MKRQQGFTIIELMIATLVFSLMMIVITTAVIQFTRQYYRGVIESSTQSTARDIIDDVTRSIEFNTGPVYTLPANGSNHGYCVGDAKRYSFALYRQSVDNNPDTVNKHQSYHALVSDSVTSCTSGTAPMAVTSQGAGLPNGDKELLGSNMRLADFSIVPLCNPSNPNDQSTCDPTARNTYQITVKVVYGDDDLLTNPTAANMTCKGGAGGQFCAVSELQTTVKKRVD